MINQYLFPVNSAIDSIFAPKNLDADCMTIWRMMSPVENAIEQYFIDGQYKDAIEMFLQLVDSICYHFVADKHWCWFDDDYAPGHGTDHCWRMILERLDRFPDDLFNELKDGLIILLDTEAYQGYCYPSIGRWLGDMKQLCA